MLKKIINQVIFTISIIVACIYLIIFIKNKDFDMIFSCLAIIVHPLLVFIIEKIFKKEIAYSIKFTYYFLMLLASTLGSVANLYDIFPSYDTLVHFISGILISWCAFDIFKYYNKHFNKLFMIIFIISFSFAIAGIWEIYEYLYDKMFNTSFQLGLDDTMQDIIAATLGCILYLGYNYKKTINDKTN